MKKITCINNSKTSKYFTGKICNNTLTVGETTEHALCWACLVRYMGNPQLAIEVKRNAGYPRGWKFMKEFVDKDGNVFHKGIEQPKLKNKVAPTEIKKKPVKKVVKKQTKIDFTKIKELKRKIKNEKDLKKKRSLQKKLEKYLQEL